MQGNLTELDSDLQYSQVCGAGGDVCADSGQHIRGSYVPGSTSSSHLKKGKLAEQQQRGLPNVTWPAMEPGLKPELAGPLLTFSATARTAGSAGQTPGSEKAAAAPGSGPEVQARTWYMDGSAKALSRAGEQNEPRCSRFKESIF